MYLRRPRWSTGTVLGRARDASNAVDFDFESTYAPACPADSPAVGHPGQGKLRAVLIQSGQCIWDPAAVPPVLYQDGRPRGVGDALSLSRAS